MNHLPLSVVMFYLLKWLNSCETQHEIDTIASLFEKLSLERANDIGIENFERCMTWAIEEQRTYRASSRLDHKEFTDKYLKQLLS